MRRWNSSAMIERSRRRTPPKRLRGWASTDGPSGARSFWRTFVPDAELGRLYWTARAFAFLSEYEGLGLTPLEALAAGVPPLLLDTPVARESCGNAAVYVAKGDVAATASALERLLYDDRLRSRLLDAAPPVLAKYTWPRAARETLALLEAAGS
jgi:glycosyltransferase involved in cell wall biosynthesis